MPKKDSLHNSLPKYKITITKNICMNEGKNLEKKFHSYYLDLFNHHQRMHLDHLVISNSSKVALEADLLFLVILWLKQFLRL